MAAPNDNTTFTVLRNLRYKEDEQQKSTEKNKLDLFLPYDSCENTPLVVFVHGGSWMRGDRCAYKHFTTFFNSNSIAALVLAYYNAYSNVGKAFSSNGIACAVVSYRLSRLQYPLIVIEVLLRWILSSFLMIFSLSTIWILCQYLLLPNYLSSLEFSDIALYITLLSIVLLWFIVCYLDTRIIASKYDTTIHIILPITLFYLTPSTNQLIWSCGYLTAFIIVASFKCYQLREPAVKHPLHVCDVAHSIAWLKQFAIKRKLYSSKSVFVCGHSAGGHIASLLALDPRYLKDVGLSIKDLKGVISISGVYDLHKLSGWFTDYLFLRPVFTDDSKLWTSASPLHQLANQKYLQKTPFLVINAEHESILKEDGNIFVEKLNELGFFYKYHVVPYVNHFSIILKFGNGHNTSTEAHCFSFIKQLH